MATEQTKVGELDAGRVAELLKHAEYQRTKELLERAEAAQREGVPAVEPRHAGQPGERTVEGDAWDKARADKDAPARPLDEAEFKELGKSIDDVQKLDPDAAANAADRAGRLSRERREPPMENEAARRAFLEAQVSAMDERAVDARKIEDYERRLDPESSRADNAKAVRKDAELQASQSQAAIEAERMPEAEREAFRRERGLDAERGPTVNVAENIQRSEDRDLALSEAAKVQFDRYQRKEIEYKDIQATDDLAEGYETNRLVAHSRVQEARLAKGEITPAELEADDEAQRGRELDEGMERARARRIEKDEERGEIEAEKAAKRGPQDANNTIEDFEAGADAQARHRVPEDVERDFPGHKAGDARTHYYAKDTDRVAFVDKGNKMQSPRDFDQQGVRAMIDVAKARGWEEVKVRGSESFRREAYLEAARRGIEVKGYNPTEAEKAIADRSKADHQKREARADAFNAAKTPEEKTDAAKQHGRELQKAYAMEAAFRKLEASRNIPERYRPDLEQKLHEKIEKDLREGKELANLKVYERKQVRSTAREAEAEQVR